MLVIPLLYFAVDTLTNHL